MPFFVGYVQLMTKPLLCTLIEFGSEKWPRALKYSIEARRVGKCEDAFLEGVGNVTKLVNTYLKCV